MRDYAKSRKKALKCRGSSKCTIEILNEKAISQRQRPDFPVLVSVLLGKAPSAGNLLVLVLSVWRGASEEDAG
jgi:hypothetical protein